jgi:hypothetical protein
MRIDFPLPILLYIEFGHVYNSDIMRDNALVNLTGLEGHCMPVDLNIEHHIKFLKVCLSILQHAGD